MRAHPDLAIDLGTTNTLVYVPARGIALSEPSLVAVDAETGDIRAVGSDAARLLGREVGAATGVRPLRRGAITDFDLALEMLQRFMRKACQRRRVHPRTLVVGVPRGATSVERRAVEEACRSAGARHIYLIDQPIAAAIGAGAPVMDAVGSVVVDVGGGVTEAALISLGEIVVCWSVRAGAEQLDDAIMTHLRRRHELLIGSHIAEEVKLRIGSVLPHAQNARLEVTGVDARSALPKTVVVTSEEIRGAIERPVERIIDAVKETLSRTPPELASDVLDLGIILAGGGSLLRGLADRLREETQVPTHIAELPVTCVAAGAGAWLEALTQSGLPTSHSRSSASAPAPDRAVPANGRATIHATSASRPDVAAADAVALATHEAAQIVRRGRQAADEVIVRSGAAADDMLAQAARQAKETIEAAQLEAAQTREAAQREADEIRADARRWSREMNGRADARDSQVGRDADAMWRECRRVIEEARTAGGQLERRLLTHLRGDPVRRRRHGPRHR